MKPSHAGLVALATVACGIAACDRKEVTPEVDRWSNAAVLAEGARFLDDATFRRAALVDSLTNPKNTYSRQRLTSYALRTKGWDLLPEWNPRSVVLDRDMADAIRRGERPVVDAATTPLWDGVRPSTIAGWAALGREVFFRYPLRREVYVEWAVAHADVGARVGVRPIDDGSYPGLVVFVDTLGSNQVGMTCAICHADPTAAGLVIGQARRAFDYGALRLAYQAATGSAGDADLARRMRTWGPGRADVTEDDDEDPVAIPDLWGLKQETFLTQAGTIKHAGATALAIRQETQLLTSNHQTVRPPRALAFALAVFLYSLKPPAPAPPADPVTVARGKTLFRGRCASCHANGAFGGDLVGVDEIETDPALANGGARGTRHYRTPPLVGVARAAPYFHDGSVATLEDVMAPERVESKFTRGFLGPGAVPGHRYGFDLGAADRAAVATYMRSL